MAARHSQGLATAFLYPVLSDRLAFIDPDRTPSPHFEQLIEGSGDPRTRRLAWEFGSLGAILLRDADVRRYRLASGHVSLAAPSATGSDPAIECVVSCDTRHDLAVVMVNLYLPVVESDAAIFLMHAAGGRRDTGCHTAACGATIAFGDGRPGTHTIHDVAQQGLAWFSAECLARTGTAPVRLGSPFWCIEVKAAFPDDIAAATADRYLDANLRKMYGLVTHDEGWRYVPETLARERLANRWGSREFFSVAAVGPGLLMVNFRCPDYRQEAEQQWTRYTGYGPSYFEMDSEIAGLEHGALAALERAAEWEVVETRCDGLIQRATQSLHDRAGFFHRLAGLVSATSGASVVDDLSSLQSHLVRDIDSMLRRSIAELNVLAHVVRRQREIDARAALIRDQVTTLAEQLRLQTEERRNHLLAVLTAVGVFLAFLTLFSGPILWLADKIVTAVAPGARNIIFYKP